MDPVSVAPADQTKRPVLYGALVVGTLVAIIATGWVLLSPSLLLQRQVASATPQPAQAEPPAPPVERRRAWTSAGRRERRAAGGRVGLGRLDRDREPTTRAASPPTRSSPAPRFLVKVPGYELRRLDGGHGPGDGHAPAQGSARRLPDLLRRGRQGHPRAGARARRPHRAQRRGHRRQGRPRASSPTAPQVPLALEAGAQGPVIIKDFDGLHRRAQGAQHLHHRAHRHLQGQRARPAPARLGHHRHAHGQALDRQREARLGRPLPRRGLGLRHRRGQGGRGQGLRRGPVRLRPLPDRRQALGGQVLPAEQRADAAARHRGLPRQGAPRARARREPSSPPTSSATPPSTTTTPTSASASRSSPGTSTTSARWSTPRAITGASPACATRSPSPTRSSRRACGSTRKRSAAATVQVRPWLQDFRDYAFDKRIFGVNEIRAQIRGARRRRRRGLHALEPEERLHGRRARPKGDGNGEGPALGVSRLLRVIALAAAAARLLLPGGCLGRVASAERARARDDPRVPQDRPARGALDPHPRQFPRVTSSASGSAATAWWRSTISSTAGSPSRGARRPSSSPSTTRRPASSG